MWYNSVLYSLENDDLSEQLLADITEYIKVYQHLNDNGYDQIVSATISLGHKCIDEQSLPAAALIIKYLKFWNTQFQNIQLWAVTNLEVLYSINVDKIKLAKSLLLPLMHEQQFYAIQATPDQQYETAMSFFLYTLIEPNCKQQATQAVLKLQQLLIRHSNQKVHLLLAKVYFRLGEIEKSKYEANLFFQQALKMACMALPQDDPLIQFYREHIQEEQKENTSKQVKTQMNVEILELENIQTLQGNIEISYHTKQNLIRFKFKQVKFDFNVSDICNEITIYKLQPLHIFLQEFIQSMLNQMQFNEDIKLISNVILLESYEKHIQIQETKPYSAILYFTDKEQTVLSPVFKTQDLDLSVHPLIYNEQ